jgi:hypothetical protein
VIYSFALTLVANYTLVYALYSAGLYAAPIVYGIFALELLALLYLMRKDRFRFSISLPSAETLAQYRELWRRQPILGRVIAVTAFAALVSASLLCYQNFGSVYLMNDDVLSWDRWAMEWATNQLAQSGPAQTGLYPQLLPTNGSITFVMMGNTDVKMFSKAIMPFFSLATLLLFLDLFHKTGKLTWLLGLSGYGFLLNFFFKLELLASGYVDIASAFFAFLAMHAFLQHHPHSEWDANFGRPVLVAVFASGALLTKQGGIYVFTLAIGWLVVHFISLKSRISWRTPALFLILILVLNWRWVETEWRVRQGRMPTNLSYLTKDIHAGRTYPQRWRNSWQMIESARGVECVPLVRLFAVGILLSTLHPHGRLVFFLMFAPFYVLWALLFSYEVRPLTMDLPFAADCFACGVVSGAGFGVRLVRFVIGQIPRPAPSLGAPLPKGLSGKAAKRAIKARAESLSLKTASALRRRQRAGGFLAALTLCGGTAWIASPLWRWVRSNPYLMDMDSTRMLSLLLGCGLAIVAPLAANRLAPLRLQLHVPLLLLLSAGAIAAAQMTLFPSRVLVQEQVEKRKSAGFASMNRRLYEYARLKPIHGKIGTDYWILDRLPGLNQYHRHFEIPRPATPEFLESVRADPEVRYILTGEDAFPPPVLVWMSQHGFRSIFEEQGFRFVELPVR